MAIIVERDRLHQPTFKSVSFPPTVEERATAVRLDSLLQRRIPDIEIELVNDKLLDAVIPDSQMSAKGGSVRLWYELGIRLQQIADDEELVKPLERKWLWEAVKLYATPRILRKDRGPSRSHLEYCYRLAKLPWGLVERFNWDDWVYLFDSKSFRQEARSDKWIGERIEELSKLTRAELRRLVREINGRFKNKETSIFDETELFAKYDKILKEISTRTASQRLQQRHRKPKASKQVSV